MDPMTNQGAPAPMNDEIDLFELFESLWKEDMGVKPAFLALLVKGERRNKN